MVRSVDSALADVMKQTQAAVMLSPALRPWGKQYWQAQAKMLEEAESFAERWFERRHTATNTALKAVDNITNGASNPSDALKIVSDWQRYSMERIVQDFQEWAELCTRCACHVSAAETETGNEAP
ncbi:hypothetical protein C1J05_02885 [Sulfitobacter sp. JL08]|uniref:hypothetical protein n=1 Tax=Sulfitobacter sp. JL08 TaxID=2070369 RepID=UPI000E0ABCC4|nr:hypothetical protein [Sulfitobacter sp. JL08]AXI53587.1 hypothetical protein C1J05_02885 [Sulfitobacter sp. JL08]